MTFHHFCDVDIGNGKQASLEFDDGGFLYIDRKKVQTESKFVLTRAQAIFGILASIGTFGTFVIELLKHFCIW